MSRSRLRGRITISACLAMLLCPAGPVGATQLDYTGEERITSQQWSIEFTVPAAADGNTCIRLPYPDYTYLGRWATYSTESVDVTAVGDCGPITYEVHHYNEGYSNQGVWVELIFSCPTNSIFLTVKQSVRLALPGIDYPLTFHTNNQWMEGSDIVDVYSPVVENVLSEALAMTGDWHERGGRSVPEKIINWMNENMSWSGSFVYYPKPASQVLTEREGHCEEWAHAACALLIRAGIPAKVVMAGRLPTYNSTPFQFSDMDWHLCAAYWDGFGWILIDPQVSSGFAIPNRVILGADRDSWNIRMMTDPQYLYDQISGINFDYDGGNYSGSLDLLSMRCTQYLKDILEHYEYSSGTSPPGFEPVSNIIPNTTTDAEYACPDVAGPGFSNYPNPFNPATTFRFIVNRPGMVQIAIFSVEGRYIETVYNNYCETGWKEVSWNSSSMSSGVYFARISTFSGTATKKVVILR